MQVLPQNPLSLVFATSVVLVGCIWNGYELEKVVAHTKGGGKQFGLGLTLVQCLFISVVAFIHFAANRIYHWWNTATPTKTGRPITVFTLQLRPALFVAGLFWLTNCINNAVFQFGIAVPIQQLVRSSSLLSTALCNYFFDGKRFSLWQVVHLVSITGGIAVLSIVGTSGGGGSSSVAASCGSSCGGIGSNSSNNKTETSTSDHNKYYLFPDPSNREAVFQWLVGVALLLLSAFMSTFLGMGQSNMYRIAEQQRPGCTKEPGVTEEAIFTSHFLSVGFFAVYFLFASKQGQEQQQEQQQQNPISVLLAMPRDLQWHIFFNCVSQYICIWGVFCLARTAGSFFLTMATTVRKFVSLVLSLVYFGHVGRMTLVQLLAVATVTVSVSVYPFLKSPAAVVEGVQQQTQQQHHQAERSRSRSHDSSSISPETPKPKAKKRKRA